MVHQRDTTGSSRSFFPPAAPAVGVIVCLGFVLSLGQLASDQSKATQSKAAQSKATQRKPLEFNPKRVCPAFPPITKFPIVRVDQVGEKISPFELVLGVTVEGKSRAYPINMLTGPRREIINDTLGGRAIAATW